MNILAFDTCLDKTYITLRNEKEVIDSRIIVSTGENYHSAYLISTIKDALKKKNLFRVFPGGAVVKNRLANAGDTGSIPGPGRSLLTRAS